MVESTATGWRTRSGCPRKRAQPNFAPAARHALALHGPANCTPAYGGLPEHCPFPLSIAPTLFSLAEHLPFISSYTDAGQAHPVDHDHSKLSALPPAAGSLVQCLHLAGKKIPSSAPPGGEFNLHFPRCTSIYLGYAMISLHEWNHDLEAFRSTEKRKSSLPGWFCRSIG